MAGDPALSKWRQLNTGSRVATRTAYASLRTTLDLCGMAREYAEPPASPFAPPNLGRLAQAQGANVVVAPPTRGWGGGVIFYADKRPLGVFAVIRS